MHTIKFFPLGDAESFLITLDNGHRILFDYGNERDPNDPDDPRIDLAEALRNELSATANDTIDVVAFTHLDRDHICRATEFFHLDYAKKYQGNDRIKIKTLWVPAAVIIEEGCDEEQAIIRAEARHRLKNGYGIRVFSRPKKLEDWLNKQGLTLESRQDLITDAGQLVPDYSQSLDGVEFFVHSPFASRLADGTLVDRNTDALAMQARFVNSGVETLFLITSDLPWEALSAMVEVTQYHHNERYLNWDIVDIPHHCSYLSLAPDKGEDKTKPVDKIGWLYEKQAQRYGILISSSRPIPSDDDDKQPPHRQAANYYRDCAAKISGEFRVTMEHPRKDAPEPLVVTIDQYKATIKKSQASAGTIITSRPAPRAG